MGKPKRRRRDGGMGGKKGSGTRVPDHTLLRPRLIQSGLEFCDDGLLPSEIWIRRALTLAVFAGILARGLTRGSGESRIELANEGPLPDLSGAIGWLNSDPLTRKSLISRHQGNTRATRIPAEYVSQRRRESLSEMSQRICLRGFERQLNARSRPNPIAAKAAKRVHGDCSIHFLEIDRRRCDARRPGVHADAERGRLRQWLSRRYFAAAGRSQWSGCNGGAKLAKSER